MGNFIKILAASVGGGLVLGAGIRLGEAIAARETSQPAQHGGQPNVDRKLADRVGALEDRLQDLEIGFENSSPAAVAVRFDAQETELAAVRALLRHEQQQVENLGETATRMRDELHGWLETSVSTRMAEVETHLKSEAERSQRQMLDAFVDTVQVRVIQRISSLEEEVAGQSAAMSELRACSLRTEQSMQKLLSELDRVIVRYPPAELLPETIDDTPAAATSSDTPPPAPVRVEEPAPPPVPPSLSEPRRRPKWSIFG